jgi:hypothetical protein
MEAGNVKRLVLIGAVDIRDRSKGYPDWYDDDDSEYEHQGVMPLTAYGRGLRNMQQSSG